MPWHWKRWLAGPVLVLSLLITACEPASGPGPELPAEPETVAGPQAMTVDADDGESYALVEARIPDTIDDLAVSKLIGVDGGSLSLAGHRLTVPAGAVDQPTLFTMTLVTNGYVEVDLSAEIELLGGLISVGADGFDEPVTLSLTYAWASDVEDPDDLVILRELDGDEPYEVLPSTVAESGKVVITDLDHFSRYCMAQ